MPEFKTLDDVDVRGKRVLVRVDLNVPMQDGKCADWTRIARLAPTLSELVAKHAKLVVISHFDRPGGKVVPSMSLKPLASALSESLGHSVAFAADCVGPAAKEVVDRLRDGQIALLENLRFHKGEEKNDPAFVAEALTLPGEAFLADQMTVVDPDALHTARNLARRAIAGALEGKLAATYERLTDTGPYTTDGAAVGRRSLRNACLAYLSAGGDPKRAKEFGTKK